MTRTREGNDWELVARRVVQAKNGDEEAFRHLLREHGGIVTSALVACGVKDYEIARDLGQEVALKAWMKLSTLQDPRSFPAWIRRIAANTARDHLRKFKLVREVDLEAAIEVTDDDDPEERVLRGQQVEQMRSILQEESPQVVAVLSAQARGVSIKDLARDSGISPNALKMRISRTRKRLRRHLQLMREQPPPADRK